LLEAYSRYRDAAIGLLIYLQDAVIASKDSFTLPQASLLLRPSAGMALNILELGAGCGLAGIAISQLRPDCAVYLTDLAEAQDLLKKNINHTNLATYSSLQCSILEWGSESTSNIPNVKFDLILISDCTYNADYCSALVQTLAAVAKLSPDVRILVSMKRRHDAEAVFEYLMAKAGLEAVESTAIPMPHQHLDIDSPAPVVEIYLYQQETRSLRPSGRAASRCPA
jgi:predicted nicotinamide N-methyase